MIDWITEPGISRRRLTIFSKLNNMAASIYIVVEGEDPGFDIFVNGQAVARNEDAIERLAARLHAPAWARGHAQSDRR